MKTTRLSPWVYLHCPACGADFRSPASKTLPVYLVEGFLKTHRRHRPAMANHIMPDVDAPASSEDR